MSDIENLTIPKTRAPTHTPNHRACPCKISVASLPFQTSLQSKLSHHFTCLHSNQRRENPLGLLPAKLLPATSIAVLCSPKVISILIPSKLDLAYVLQHHAMCLGNGDFRKDEESIHLYFKAGYQLLNFSSMF